MRLDHTIVPAKDKVASAEFFAKVMGLQYEGAMGHFAPVRINSTMTMDFDNREAFESHHYAFMVSDEEFDAIFDRVKAGGIVYGSEPRAIDDMQINQRKGGRGFYFKDPDGHSMEVMTK
jgi:catechol 2,3-dioxygenase-like lactoylglutathione lyase family enzyme